MSTPAPICYFCRQPIAEDDEKIFLMVKQINGPDISVVAHKSCADNKG
jgi:hypothetical protein